MLGAILINNTAHTHVADFLHTSDFYDPLHAGIYDAMSKLIEAGQRADWVTLKTFFESAPAIDATTNATQYLGKLAANATTVVNAGSYGRVIKDVSTQRRLLIAEDLQKAARQPTAEFSPSQQIAEHLQHLTALDGGRSRLEAVSVPALPASPCRPGNGTPRGSSPRRTRRLLVVAHPCAD